MDFILDDDDAARVRRVNNQIICGSQEDGHRRSRKRLRAEAYLIAGSVALPEGMYPHSVTANCLATPPPAMALCPITKPECATRPFAFRYQADVFLAEKFRHRFCQRNKERARPGQIVLPDKFQVAIFTSFEMPGESGRNKIAVEFIDVPLTHCRCSALFDADKQFPEPLSEFTRLPSNIVQLCFREGFDGRAMFVRPNLARVFQPLKQCRPVRYPFPLLPMRRGDGIQKIERKMVSDSYSRNRSRCSLWRNIHAFYRNG